MGEDGITTMNFAIEHRGGAPAEKREREERRRLELKTSSPTRRARPGHRRSRGDQSTPSHLRGAALRPPTAARCSSEPLRLAAHHRSVPRRLPRGPPSAARLRARRASPPARLKATGLCRAGRRPHEIHARVHGHCPLCSVRAKFPLPVSTCQRLSTQAKYYRLALLTCVYSKVGPN